MNKLPEELLTEIFAYLQFNDLCQLTLTCKLFNEIISNNSSLMDKFILKCNNDDRINLDLMTKRKYRRIKIQTINERLFKLLEYYGDTICHIKIQHYELEMKDFRRILTLCPNVKQLNADIDKIAYSNDDLTKPVMKLTLDSLTINIFDSKIFKSLQVDAKNICLDIKGLNSMSKIALINFLRSQKQLKTLKLSSYCSKLFVDDSLTNAEFQLETLAVDFLSFANSNLENLKKFLENQKSLVRIIDENVFRVSTNCNYVNMLRDCENVKELKVPGPYNFFHPLPHIDKFTIDLVCLKNTNRDIGNIFPNVKSLIIHSLYKIKFVKNLTKVAPKNCVEFTISDNVKTLAIKYVKFSNDCLFDDDVDIKIESLTISHSDNINWLINCFKNDRINLKSLMIEETKMKKSQREYLESLTRGDDKKIQKLKICMPIEYDENHDYICCYQIENESDDVKRIKLG